MTRHTKDGFLEEVTHLCSAKEASEWARTADTEVTQRLRRQSKPRNHRVHKQHSQLLSVSGKQSLRQEIVRDKMSKAGCSVFKASIQAGTILDFIQQGRSSWVCFRPAPGRCALGQTRKVSSKVTKLVEERPFTWCRRPRKREITARRQQF